jgi:hypothetical protein
VKRIKIAGELHTQQYNISTADGIMLAHYNITNITHVKQHFATDDLTGNIDVNHNAISLNNCS